MEPIINPIWIYLINVGEGLANIFLILGIILLTGGIIVLIIMFIDETFSKKIFTNSIRAAIFGIVFLILNIFIPSKDTCYQMIALNMITPNNIKTVGESAEDFVDYVFDNIDKLIEDGTADVDEEGD